MDGLLLISEMIQREEKWRNLRDRRYGSWHREHHGCTYSWGRACSCSSGSNERVGVLLDVRDGLVSEFERREKREMGRDERTHCV